MKRPELHRPIPLKFDGGINFDVGRNGHDLKNVDDEYLSSSDDYYAEEPQREHKAVNGPRSFVLNHVDSSAADAFVDAFKEIQTNSNSSSSRVTLEACRKNVEYSFCVLTEVTALLERMYLDYAKRIEGFLKIHLDGCKAPDLEKYNLDIRAERKATYLNHCKADLGTNRAADFWPIAEYAMQKHWFAIQTENKSRLVRTLGKLRSQQIVRSYVEGEKGARIDWIRDDTSGKLGFYGNKIIGKGGNSLVFQGVFQKPTLTSKAVAIKRVDTAKVNMADSELNIWKSLEDVPTSANANVVRLFGSVLQKKGVKEYRYFAMELAQIDLEKEVKLRSEHTRLRNRDALVGYLRDAGNGLQWLHSQKPVIIHRDLKPNNILIFCNLETGKEVAKISDFGISRQVKDVLGTGTASVPKGAFHYSPPEVLEMVNPHSDAEATAYASTKGDIFSFGITAFYTMSYGKHPFFLQGPFYRIFTNILDRTPDTLNPPEYLANYLLHWMMEKKSEDRPTIEQVLSHPFFWDIKKCFHFLVEVGKAFDTKNSNIRALRDRIDKDYLDVQRDAAFDWKSKLDEIVVDEFTGMHKKKYNQTASIMTLIEFIRDKTMHYAEISKKLLTPEYFGDDIKGSFDDEKFAKYILDRFDNLLAFLYVELGTNELEGISKLKKDFQISTHKSLSLQLLKATGRLPVTV